MRKKYILFDLDGTLTNPKEGITRSVQYALRSFGIEEENLDKLEPYIGPPLYAGFMENHGFTREDAETAVWKYREYFEKQGIWENKRYDGILELLKELKEQGKILVMATSKPENFAKMIAEHFGMEPYFTVIAGSMYEGGRTDKAEVIQYALDLAGITDLRDVVMVGDRKHDIEGAKTCGVDSVGVLYGFGNREELERAGADWIVETVDELRELLKN